MWIICLAITIRQWSLAILIITIAAAPADPQDHLMDLLEGRGPLLRLHLHDVQLLRGVETEQRRLSFKDLHTQQPSLGVRRLSRTSKERLQQRVEPLQVKRDVT